MMAATSNAKPFGVRKKNLSKKSMSDTASDSWRQLESWASDRVKQWPRKLQTDDYDFRSWADGASKSRLQAGAIYEYARESRRLRCLVALMNPKRPREAWEVMRPALIDGRRPEPGEIESYPAEANYLPCSFQGVDEHDAERALSGFLYSLCDLADYLADNISFGELFRTKRDELENAFGGFDKLSRVNREFRYFLRVIDPVSVATESEAEHATVWESVSDDKKRMISSGSCSEVVAIQIHWRFTDKEIAAGMKKLMRALRPRHKKYKPRQPKKGSRRDSSRSALDALSAMRLASYVPKASVASAEALASYLSGDFQRIEFEASAIGLFEMVRLGGRREHIAESNFDGLVVEARKLFQREFPFGEDAANAPALADRVMMKSERLSSQDKA